MAKDLTFIQMRMPGNSWKNKPPESGETGDYVCQMIDNSGDVENLWYSLQRWTGKQWITKTIWGNPKEGHIHACTKYPLPELDNPHERPDTIDPYDRAMTVL